MKRVINIFILRAIVFTLTAASLQYNGFTDLTYVTSAKVIVSTDRIEHIAVSQEDLPGLVDILNHKKLSKDPPSCVFSVNTAIQFDSRKVLYCFALDGCPILYLPYQDRYLYLSHEDYENLLEILENYDFTLPET